MFTGIVEAVGEIATVHDREDGRTLQIRAPFARDLSSGQSIAVDGACLTATRIDPDAGTFAVEAGSSTLSRTIASTYRPGTQVNLERAVQLGDRLDGHMVQGHVDGLATLRASNRSGDTRFLDFELPAEAHRTTVLHGSIAINGISLTVNALGDGAICQVAIIPYTWRYTNLSTLAIGDSVNVEADLIGKYVHRMLAPHAP